MNQMSELDYALTWVVYLLAVLLANYLWWKMTNWIRWDFLRSSVRLSVFTILIVPITVSSEIHSLAPAFMALAFELLASDDQAWQRPGYLLLGALLVANCMLLGYRLFRRGGRDREQAISR